MQYHHLNTCFQLYLEITLFNNIDRTLRYFFIMIKVNEAVKRSKKID